MTHSDSAAALRAAAERFLRQVGHWSEERWTLPRAQLAYGLVQRLADLAAAVEGRPPREVPRLPTNQALPDQFRVMIADLLTARPSQATLAEATEAVTAAQRAL